MSIGVNTIVKNKPNREIAIIGLGGGGLCTFIRHFIPQVTKIYDIPIKSKESKQF